MQAIDRRQDHRFLRLRAFRTLPSPPRSGQFGIAFGIALIVLATIAIQFRFGPGTDEIWLMLLCDRLLDGQTAYVDFLENCPPFAILIYMPPVLAARFFGIAREPMLIAYVIGLTAASSASCAYLLARVKRLDDVGEIGALAVIASLLLVPSADFGQKDHIALILELPFLTALALRAEALRPDTAAAMAAGLASGAALAVRPDFAVGAGLVILYVAVRRGLWSLFAFSELYVAAASTAASIAISLVCFPHYFATMLPIIRDAYIPNRDDWDVLLVGPGTLPVLTLLIVTFICRVRLGRSPIAAIPVIFSIGTLGAFLIQGKNVPPHIYPAVALSLIAFVITAAPRLARLDAIILAAVSICVVWSGLNQEATIRVGITLGLSVCLVAFALYEFINREILKKGAQELTTMVAVAYGFSRASAPLFGSSKVNGACRPPSYPKSVNSVYTLASR